MICLSGLPASGKTTFARAYAARHPDIQIVFFDSFLASHEYQDARTLFFQQIAFSLMKMAVQRNGINKMDWVCHSFKTRNSEPESTNQVAALLENALRDIRNINVQQNGSTCWQIVCEHTFQHRSARSLVQRIANELGIPCLFVHFEIALDDSISRNSKRDSRVTVETIQNVYKQFDAFETSEQVLHVALNKDTDSVIDRIDTEFAKLLQLADSRFNNYVLTVQRNIATASASNAAKIQRYDIESRKLMRQVLQDSQMLELAQQLNAARRKNIKMLSNSKSFDFEVALAELRDVLLKIVVERGQSALVHDLE